MEDETNKRIDNLCRFLGIKECNICNGTGYTQTFGCLDTCSECMGQGYVEDRSWNCRELKINYRFEK